MALSYPAVIEIAIILLAAFLSFKTTDGSIRRENHFTWSAIKEVAVLFVGIFITMQPALMLLKASGPRVRDHGSFPDVLGHRASVQLPG